MTIRVLIADDHAVVAESLRCFIEAEPDMKVVGVAGNGQEAVHRALLVEPDVVVMDNAMPLVSGTEAARKITGRSRQIRVVMLSMHSNAVHVQRALQAGASGYVAKNATANELVAAIRAVHAGQRYLSKPLADDLLDRIMAEVPEDRLQRLSVREREVLQMMAEGNSIVRIATVLSLSRKTVETYRERMMQKLGLDNFAALVKFAVQQGLTPLE